MKIGNLIRSYVDPPLQDLTSGTAGWLSIILRVSEKTGISFKEHKKLALEKSCFILRFGHILLVIMSVTPSLP
jgi:hypothetical protein